jgi:hypothetical protein
MKRPGAGIGLPSTVVRSARLDEPYAFRWRGLSPTPSCGDFISESIDIGSAGSEETMSAFVEMAVAVGGVCVACILAIPLAYRLAPKWIRGGKERLADEAERVEELERRVGELEARQQRVAELEERLDFAERLLAQQRDAPRVGPAKS